MKLLSQKKRESMQSYGMRSRNTINSFKMSLLYVRGTFFKSYM